MMGNEAWTYGSFNLLQERMHSIPLAGVQLMTELWWIFKYLDKN